MSWTRWRWSSLRFQSGPGKEPDNFIYHSFPEPKFLVLLRQMLEQHDKLPDWMVWARSNRDVSETVVQGCHRVSAFAKLLLGSRRSALSVWIEYAR